MNTTGKSIEQYYMEVLREELNIWAHRAQAPKDVEILSLNLLTTEHRHGSIGVKWTAVYTGGVQASGWISLCTTKFDMDVRPDN